MSDDTTRDDDLSADDGDGSAPPPNDKSPRKRRSGSRTRKRKVADKESVADETSPGDDDDRATELTLDDLGIAELDADLTRSTDVKALEDWDLDDAGDVDLGDQVDESLVPINRWAAISSYADTASWNDRDAARDSRVRERSRQRASRERFNWRDLIVTKNDARSTLLLSIAGGALVLALIAGITAVTMQQRASSYQSETDARIADLTSQIDEAAGELTTAGDDVAALVPALQNRLFTVTIASMGDVSGVGRIGDWDVFTPTADSAAPTMREAMNFWGVPTKATPLKGDKSICRAVWEDAGIAGTFTASSISVGVFDPVYCDYPDLISPTNIRMSGSSWTTSEGIRVGSTEDEVTAAYPDAQKKGSNYWLASEFSAAEGTDAPLLVAQLKDGAVTALVANIN